MRRPHHRSTRVWQCTHCRSWITQFYLHTHAFIHDDHEWNKPYLPLPSQPKLVLICPLRSNWRGIRLLSVPTRKVSEGQRPVILNFVEFRKAFDNVHKPALWKIIEQYGIQSKIISTTQKLYGESTTGGIIWSDDARLCCAIWTLHTILYLSKRRGPACKAKQSKAKQQRFRRRRRPKPLCPPNCSN